jgi:hypothetical protein
MRKLSHESDVTDDDYKRHEPSNSRVRKSRAIQTILRRVETFHSERNNPLQPDMKQTIADQLQKLARMKDKPPSKAYSPYIPYEQHNNVFPRSREMGLLSDGELEDRGFRRDSKKPRSDIAPEDLLRNLAQRGPHMNPNPNPVNKDTQNEVAQLLNLLRCYRVDSTVAQDIYNQLLEIIDIDDFPVVE